MALQLPTHSCKALRQEQREFYVENGWLLVEGAISDTALERMRAATDAIVNGARTLTESRPGLTLWETHTADAPCLYDVSSPENLEPAFWEFASTGAVVDMACDLLGPAVRYRYSTIRFRELGPADLWHQDMPFDEIQGEGVLAGIHLHDTGPRHPHLQVISGSQRGETFTHRDARGDFIGELNSDEMKQVAGRPTEDIIAPAGSIEFLDYRTLHQDMWGGAERGGALVYFAYSTADAVPAGEPRYPEVPSTRRGQPLA
jgi:hypothetical protein